MAKGRGGGEEEADEGGPEVLVPDGVAEVGGLEHLAEESEALAAAVAEAELGRIPHWVTQGSCPWPCLARRRDAYLWSSSFSRVARNWRMAAGSTSGESKRWLRTARAGKGNRSDFTACSRWPLAQFPLQGC